MGKNESRDENPELTPEEQAAGDDYLSQLANSVLNQKTPFPYKKRVQGKARQQFEQERRAAISGEHPKPDVSERQSTPIPKPFSSAKNAKLTANEPSTPRPAATPSTPRPMRREAQAFREAQAASSDGTFPVGTILLFEDGSLGVYKDSRPDKAYEVVSMLEKDGTVAPSGLAMENYDLKVLGTLPREFVLRMNRRGTWERDEIVYHLDIFDYCEKIPDPQPSDETHRRRMTPAEATPLPVKKNEEKGLSLGRRFTISFGAGKEWGGVYWGEDELGSVVAHSTHDKWALMHLDLKRFEESFKLGEMVPPEELDKIRDDIARG